MKSLGTLILGPLLLMFGCAGLSKNQIKQAEIEYDMGVNEMHQGRITQALKNFQQAVLLHPKFAQAHNGLGLTYHFLEQNTQALEHFAKALALDPSFNEVRNNIGRVLISQNRFREAIPCFEKALEDVFLKERYLAESNLGWALYNVGQEKKGIKLVMNALALNGRYCVGYEYLGLMYQKQKRLGEAIREFEQLLEICPEHILGRLYLAKAQLMLGSIEQGCRHLSVCLERSRMTKVGRQCDRLYRSSCTESR